MPGSSVHSSLRPAAFGARQGGVALILSLVVLLIVTVLGVAGLQTTSLQERMAANARDRDIAFQAAEAALRDAETVIESLGPADLAAFQDWDPNSPTWAADGRYELEDSTGAAAWETMTDTEWQGTNAAAVVADFDADQGVARNPRFVIEHVARLRTDEDRLNMENYGAPIGAPTDIFRVTAYGTGGSANATVMLQTTYGKIM